MSLSLSVCLSLSLSLSTPQTPIKSIKIYSHSFNGPTWSNDTLSGGVAPEDHLLNDRLHTSEIFVQAGKPI